MKLTLLDLYTKMRSNMGPSGWWPADSKEEIIIGAIMIQNTNWRNADRAVTNFRQKTHFDPQKINQLSQKELADLTRAAGFYKNKSRAVDETFNWLSQYQFDYQLIRHRFGDGLRKQLLKLHGIGDETADVLLTYVFDVPTFVADHYARLLFTQLGIPQLTNYQSLASLVTLPDEFGIEEAQDFHGLIDEFGKRYFHPLTKFQESFLANYQLIL